MTSFVKVIVICRRGGKIIASYDLGYGVTIGLSSPPAREKFIDEAKGNLSTLGIAMPPYEGIEFEVLYP